MKQDMTGHDIDNASMRAMSYYVCLMLSHSVCVCVIVCSANQHSTSGAVGAGADEDVHQTVH
jgi:hypothetical protein